MPISGRYTDKKIVATTLGFFLAPLTAALCLLALGWAKSGGDFSAVEWLFWGGIFYFFTLGATLLIALPAYLLLNRVNQVTWWSAVLLGSFTGALAALAFQPINGVYPGVGGLSGLVFWMVRRQGR